MFSYKNTIPASFNASDLTDMQEVMNSFPFYVILVDENHNIVMANNKPLGAIIGLDLLEKIQLELVVKQALKESKSRKTKVIETVQDLEKDLQELEK